MPLLNGVVGVSPSGTVHLNICVMLVSYSNGVSLSHFLRQDWPHHREQCRPPLGYGSNMIATPPPAEPQHISISAILFVAEEGLVITTRIIGVLRADTLSIEQCTFDRDCSRGVLDSIRICLGLVRATSLQRGQHEDFELADTKTLAPGHLKSKKGQDVFAPEASAVEYNHRTPDITFYIHHLVQDNGSLIGRCPRIFCVWRETESDGGVRCFVGPYALKVYYADHASDCFKDDLISVARRAQVKNVLLPTCRPEVVQRYTNTQAATLVPNVSDLKRLLVQCSDYDEFEKAFTDFTGGIALLAEQDLVHRDLSIGNVLLSQDTLCPSAFLSDAAASAGALLRVSVSFTQRPLEQRMGGLIHDMDMAGRLHRLPEQSPADSTSTADLLAMLLDTPGPPARAEQPETPPFMAIGLLVDGGPHLVAYDLLSLLFVMVLFFWSHPTFLSDIPFPQLVPAKSRTWPPDVLRWANRPAGCPVAELGFVKRGFFQNHRSFGIYSNIPSEKKLSGLQIPNIFVSFGHWMVLSGWRCLKNRNGSTDQMSHQQTWNRRWRIIAKSALGLIN
ncbi:hypothetical protein B0H14DRAFT_3709268 [Mycena olivaceomarginata]|nr:hypothetical protein B0H14DRAFT_3709268 [Mycena olivaceomarginata]